MGAENSCRLLGPVALFIQFFMAAVAVGGLLVKRQYEHPKRTWRVWSYDVGKQMIGSAGIHLLNVLLSIMKSQGLLGTLKKTDDQCDWFFVNLLMDTTVGIPILWCWLVLIHKGLQALGVQNIESGNYYPTLDKPEPGAAVPRTGPMFSAFVKQLLVFVSGLAMMKVCIFLLLGCFEQLANLFADLVLGWSDPWPNLQVFLVMFVFPVLLNCFQYFCVDNIIKLPSDRLTRQNVDNFDQESIFEQNGVYVPTLLAAAKQTYLAV
ncbi:AAL091Cp [Eremothecium gossypii ATCC 10895]|uniref:AAL091Cp n=1 Tax=Eremothecium gossypii (strain ATCC 10895 / CBS 109.51 / FGSC 9923 / NRRL Y-1056) TaxID=284811 RepID=Q75F19_EREGS|nr:AAL091Cp [Eremothecium gossypii ATCC 10895]AAS50275.1 AAL091Cp [Eremothecium gossypii ATCC 10895]AEY94560.1 FAAL091Cp [Eremothecium gossypii FDAG1]